MNNTVEQTKRPFTREEILFFENGFFTVEITDPVIKDQIDRIGAAMVNGLEQWDYDEIDSDIKMPRWSAHYEFDDQLCRDMVDLYLPIIKQYSFIYDEQSRVTELSMQAGIHTPALSWHSDYIDTHRADAFILTYPGTIPLNGGELLVGKRTIWNAIDETIRIKPDPYTVVFINNMNPFFVHKVLPLTTEDNFKRLVCSIGWRRNDVLAQTSKTIPRYK